RGDAAGVGLAGGGQLYAASRTAEQRQAKEFLQPADLPADGALGQRQLVGRAGEALVAGGGLEGDQRGGAGNLAAHYAKTSRDKPDNRSRAYLGVIKAHSSVRNPRLRRTVAAPRISLSRPRDRGAEDNKRSPEWPAKQASTGSTRCCSISS